MVTLKRFLEVMKKAHNGELPLSKEQLKAIKHDHKTPLWMIAGPGTGKTHTLSWMVLKRILVDGIPLQRIIITTFTRKASAELATRLITQRQVLINHGLKEALDLDLSQLKVGTLHGLCSQILQDHRYAPALRIRILEDELTQQFFVRRNRNILTSCEDISFWELFGMANATDKYPPNKAKKVENACKLFNRLTENQVNQLELINSGDSAFNQLGQAYQQYQQSLIDNHRTDQAHLQRHLLDFLATTEGIAWLDRGFTILVDEYQDTNPIQEEIYFKLAGIKGDITVVGDDDQSLYRFRGATVEALIDFDKTCHAYLGKNPTKVYLSENLRSHPGIVSWVNRFMQYHPEMQDGKIRVRAPGKPPLFPASKIIGKYPSVMAIAETSGPKAAGKMVKTIQELIEEGLLTDYSQVAILTYSTKESSHAIGTYTGALENVGIPFSNPRNKKAQTDDMFMAMLGALSYILEPDFEVSTWTGRIPKSVLDYLEKARSKCLSLLNTGANSGLAKYIEDSKLAVSRAKYDLSKKDNYLVRKGGLRVTLAGLLYKLLAHEPFAARLKDPLVGERLKALTVVLSEYESLYNDGQLRIQYDPVSGCSIDRWVLFNLYSVFIEGIHDGLNDPEDEDVSIQSGAVNIMTIHQSKGLQFEVVFVLRPDKQPYESDTHVLEDILEPFINRKIKPRRRPRSLRAAEDAIRLFYVAYSRAKSLLVLTGCKIDQWDRVLGCDSNGNRLNSKVGLQSVGVHIL